MTAKKTPAPAEEAFTGHPLPVIPLRDMVLFPGTVSPLLLGRAQSLNALARALAHPGQTAFFTLQENARDEEPLPSDLKPVGVIGRVLSSTALPNGLSKVLVEGQAVGVVRDWKAENDFLTARGSLQPSGSAKALASLVAGLESDFAEYVGQRPDAPQALADLLAALPGPLEKAYAAAGQLKLPTALRQALIENPDPAAKLRMTREFLSNEIAANSDAHRLEHEVRAGIAQSQKEYFLSEHLRKIQAELGQGAPSVHPEIRKLEAELRARGLPAKALDRALTELRRLDYVHSSSPEYSVIRGYVDWFLALPWDRATEDRLDLGQVKARLDRDHFGLKDVKDRILEHVAVFKLTRERKNAGAPILCLVGPPGTGKTSLGRSVATALGREFARVSLGGLRDEAEIRGHRRTYIGSMPGRIVQALKKCRSMNPVILLDEIDKMGGDFRGDPASALLEVLDPEQNGDFTDHFLETGIDLSRVFFITTANVEERIPGPLHDRLEVIRLPGYYDSEKLEIARRHLLPRIREAAGLTEKQLEVSDAALAAVARRYTREAGVRQLHRELSKLARKRAREVASGKPAGKAKPAALQVADLRAYLGLPVRQEKSVPAAREPGIVTGLAWTAAGGETLRVECTLLSGRGKLTLTGNLGDVMKESAHIALTLARQRAQRYGIDPALFQKTDVHLHVPEGAIAKDGPSAGIAMVLALVSAMTRRPVDPRLAFTGEVSLAGHLHAIGGLPEKALAALQAGVTRLCIPHENAPDAGDLPKEARKGLKISLCHSIDEVLALVFGKKRKSLG
ncbi:MAG: ATP-dependent proteinase [Fibrobacteria bacterium]|jgi:ATP-dependent Lon protease|nr:ATP-dependent proteinase [Fibrobacteria bacterium]